jgi:hypothetical protein
MDDKRPEPKFKLGQDVKIGGRYLRIEFALFQLGEWHYGMAGWPGKWFPEDVIEAGKVRP